MGKKGILIAAITVALTIAIMSFGSASAVDKVDLFFLVDGSGSIDEDDFKDLQMKGLAEAINDSTVIPQDGRVSVCVILFGSGDAKVIVSPTTINSQSTADLVSETVKNQSQPGGRTPMAKAFDLAVKNFPRDRSGRQVIDLSTDGKPDNERSTTNSRDAALKKGFDEVNAIGVGLKPGGKEEQFLQNLTFPQPSTSAPGFYIAAVDYEEFKAKMRDKIIKEVQRGPSSKQAAAVGALASAAFVVWAILNRLTNARSSRKSRGKGGKAGPHDYSTLSGEGGTTQQGPFAKDNLEPGTVRNSLDVSEKLMGDIEPFEKREGRKVGKGGIIGPKEPSSTEVLCQKCGKKNDRKARFCTNCGISLVREDR
jgi:uncharacterized protein YegL